MLKKGLFILVFLLLLPNVFSSINTTVPGEESLYSGTVKDGEIVSVDDFEFKFTVASEGGVIIEYGTQRTLVMENNCKYKDNFHICVGDISFSYRNVSRWYDVYEAVIDISVVKGTLTITKTIEKTKLLIGETSEIELFLENTGSKEVQNIIFKDSYPSSIGITGIEGCAFNRNNNSIELKGSLIPHVKESCSYTLTGLEAVEYDSKAEASYFDSIAAQTAYSDEVEIKVYNYSLQFEHSLNSSALEIGKFINFSFVLENIYDENIAVSYFKIDIPSGLKILKSKDLNQQGQTLSWGGELESNEKRNFTVELQAVKTGNTPIYIWKKYQVEKLTREFKDPININIYCSCISISHEISDKPIAGKETTFKVYLSNPSYINDFKDLRIDVSSNIPFAEEISSFYPVFDKQKSLSLYNYQIKVPEQGAYHYNISIGYNSDSGQYFSTEKNILIKEGVEEELPVSTNESSNSTIENQNEDKGESSDETTVVKAETTEKNETAGSAEEKEIETTIVGIEDKKPPFVFVSIVLIVLVIMGVVIGMINIKKAKPKNQD
ncbi:hypothetical protein ISS05_01940 [Candidatus Woesearchaeota archaeon]|nr:hypothetical protein [Candidatus Woesearchaeota archaeon]